MKPPPFDYAAPGTVAEAVSLLAAHEGEAKALAGGQSLMPLLAMRLARPGMLVDLNRIAELDYVREVDGALAIGAMTRKRTVELSPLVRTRQPLFHAATVLIGHPQIRNRGTVGGSLAQADPAAEYPAAAVALDAEVRTVGPKGARTIAAGDFFVTYLTTALEPAEIVTELRLPAMAEHGGWSFLEISRRHGDFAMTGAAVTLALSSGRAEKARIVLFGVAPIPYRARAAEDLLLGEKPSDGLFERAAEAASGGIEEPLSDIHASAEYRRHLARVMTRRALVEAAARAGSPT